MKKKLTEASILRLKSDNKKDCFVTESSGLSVRTYETNRQVFCVKIKQANGSYSLKTIGNCREMKVKEAREIAINLINSAKCYKFVTSKTKMSLLCDKYIENYSKIYKKSWKEDHRRVEKHIKPQFGEQNASDIKTLEVLNFYSRLASDAHYEANRIIETFRGVWKQSQNWGLIELEDPSLKIKLKKEKARNRWLSDEEIKRLIIAVDSSKSEHLADAVKLFLLTGLRSSELRNTKWSNLNTKAKTLSIEDTKNGLPFCVTLSDEAIEVLKNRKKKGLYIFGGEKPLVTFKTSWNVAVKKARLFDVRIHDLRRTFASRLVQNGTSLFIVGKMLNHQSSESTKVYAYLAKQDTASIMQEYAKKINL